MADFDWSKAAEPEEAFDWSTAHEPSASKPFAQPPETSEERALREIEAAPAPAPQPSFFSKLLTGIQQHAAESARHIASGEARSGFFPESGPLSAKAAGVPQHLATDILAARAYQGVNPFAGGRTGNEAIENDPGAQASVNKLTDAAGETGAAALQAGAQIVPGFINPVSSAAVVGRAVNAGRLAGKAAAVKSVFTGAVSGAVDSALGAPEGERLDAAESGALFGGALAGGSHAAGAALGALDRTVGPYVNATKKAVGRGGKALLHSVSDTQPSARRNAQATMVDTPAGKEEHQGILGSVKASKIGDLFRGAMNLGKQEFRLEMGRIAGQKAASAESQRLAPVVRDILNEKPFNAKENVYEVKPAANGVIPAPVVRDESFNPTFATYLVDEAGQLRVRVVSVPVEGEPQFREFLAPNERALLKLKFALNDNNVPVVHPQGPTALAQGPQLSTNTKAFQTLLDMNRALPFDGRDYAVIRDVVEGRRPDPGFFDADKPLNPDYDHVLAVQNGVVRVLPTEGRPPELLQYPVKTANQAVEPMFKPAAESGNFLFHPGTDAYVNSKAVQVVGRDPDSKGNYLVSVRGEQGATTLSVPGKDIHPAEFATAPLAPSRPDPVRPEELAAMTPAEKQARLKEVLPQFQAYAKARDHGPVDKLNDLISNDYRRGPANLEAFLTQQLSAKNLGDPSMYLKTVRAQLPTKGLLDPAAKDLGNVVKGKLTWAQFQAKHPEVGQHQVQVLEGLRQRIADNSAELEALGAVPKGYSAQRLSGLMEGYLSQVYKAHVFGRGNYAEIVPEDAVQTAAEELSKLAEKHGQGWHKASIAREIAEILHADSPATAWQTSKLGQAWKALTKRETLPPFITKLLDPVESGPVQMAVTLAKQEALLPQLRGWNWLVNQRVMDATGQSVNPHWSPGPRPDLPVQVPNVPEKFGPAAGGYVGEHMRPFVEAAKAVDDVGAVQKALGFTSKVLKTNQVGLNHAVWIKNVANWLKYSVRAGGIDLTRPVESGRNFATAWKALREYGKNPTADGPARLVHEAFQQGGMHKPFFESEWGEETHKLFRELSKDMERNPNASVWDHLNSIRERAVHGVKVSTKAMRHVFDFTEEVLRMQAYLNNRSKYLAEGMSVDQAAALATKKLNRYLPDFQNVSKIQAGMSKLPFVFNPYTRAITEDLRANAMFGQDLLKHVTSIGQRALNPKADPGDLRFAGEAANGFMQLALVMGALHGATKALRRFNGILDEEVDAAATLQPRGRASFRPAQVALPFRDAHGRVQFGDFTGWLEDFQWLKGAPEDNVLARFATNLFADQFATPYQDPLRNKIEQFGGPQALPQFPDQRTPGETLPQTALRQASGFGVLPAQIGRFQRAEAGTEPGKPTKEVLTRGQAVASEVGAFPISPVTVSRGGPSHLGSLNELKFRLKERQDAVRALFKDPSVSQQQRQRALLELADFTAKTKARLAEIEGALNRVENKTGGKK